MLKSILINQMIKIVGVGDIMPGGLLSDSPNPCANKEVLNALLQGDVRCGTLDCALGNEPTYLPAKVAERGNVIYAKDADVRRLKELHINVVSLANNHFFDLGEAGVLLPLETLLSENQEEIARLFVEVQKTSDVTYFLMSMRMH